MDKNNKENALRSLYEFITKTTYDDIPTLVSEEAKRALLDVVGCGIGARMYLFLYFLPSLPSRTYETVTSGNEFC